MRDDLGAIVAELAAIRELLQEMAADRAVRAGRVQPGDAPLLLAILEQVGPVAVFASAEITAAAEAPLATREPLRRALAGANASDARRLGKVLQRLAGQALAGLRLERVGDDRSGALWLVRECAPKSREHPRRAAGGRIRSALP